MTGSYSLLRCVRRPRAGQEDALLSGSSDKLFYRRVSDLFTGRRAQGANLETTLDPKVQAAAADGLKGINGAAVALDPKTGAILAMVSNPHLRPQRPREPRPERWSSGNSKALNADPAKPTLNRTINEYPPTVVKVVTAAAALSTGEYDENSLLPGPAVLDLPDTSADLPNHDDRACGSSEEVTMTEALAVSCNTAFAYLGHADRRRRPAVAGREVRIRRRARGADAGHPEQRAGRPEQAAAGAVVDRPVRRAGHGRCRWRWWPPGWATAAPS